MLAIPAGWGLALKMVCIPSEYLLEKGNCFIGKQLSIVSGLGYGLVSTLLSI